MTLELLVLFATVALLLVGFMVFLRSFREELSSLRASMDVTKDTVNTTLATSTRDIHERLSRAADVIAELKKETGAFTEVGRSMKDLQEYLRSPKLRGNIGEMVLKDLISQLFPKASYSLQHRFKSGDIVDAVIRTDGGLLPIDSKFPLENFQKMVTEPDPKIADSLHKVFTRDIKSHVGAIGDKYILPGEGTLDFALMYVLSESVYAEIACDDTLMDYARTRRVYPVSPNTLYAALQTILLSFEGKRIESKAKEVFALLRSLSLDYEKSLGTLETLGTHLTNAYNKFGEVHAGFHSLGQKLSHSRSLAPPSDEKLIAK